MIGLAKDMIRLDLMFLMCVLVEEVSMAPVVAHSLVILDSCNRLVVASSPESLSAEYPLHFFLRLLLT